MEAFFSAGAFVSYLAALVLTFFHFEFQEDRTAAWAERAIQSGLVAHGALVVTTLSQGGLSWSLVRGIDLGSFLIVATSYILQWRYGAKFLTLFSLPTALLFALLGMALSKSRLGLFFREDAVWLWIHTGFILMGFGALVAAVSSAGMYLFESAQLKSKHVSRILRLPPLSTLDRVHFISLLWGVILFSLGLGIGLLWASVRNETLDLLKDPKVILSSFLCILYWLILSLRLSNLRRGQKIATGTVIVFLVFFVTVMGHFYSSAGFHRGF